jgi:hypothetical protein
MEQLYPLTASSSSDKKRMLGAMDLMLRGQALRTDGLIPAEVIQFDRKNNIATVRPLIMWVDVQDQAVPRVEFADISVISLGAGGFHISFPVKPGDIGWIMASDRDLSQFKATLREAKPNTGRHQKFEDGWFIPDVFRNYLINAEDADAMVIQSVDSLTRISIRHDNIKITAPVKVTVDTPLTEFTGDVKIDKKLQVVDTVTMNKDAVIAIDAKVAGISVIGHGHISSAPGTRTSGGMLT